MTTLPEVETGRADVRYDPQAANRAQLDGLAVMDRRRVERLEREKAEQLANEQRLIEAAPIINAILKGEQPDG